jgi:putative two-component system response regulator
MDILIVDDTKTGREALRAPLLRAGHLVEAVGSGLEALSALRAAPRRLVISAWTMHGTTGPDLCKAIRSGGFAGIIHCILVLPQGSVDRQQAIAAGADDFITKPFEADDLAMRVRWVERSIDLETRQGAVFALARLAESRDPTTGNHIERVRNYVRILATDLAEKAEFSSVLNARYLDILQQASALHDIGNIAIPDCILLKPGRLSESEFKIIQTHTSIGARTLASEAAEYPDSLFLATAVQIALSHHERYDGLGYPSGIKGDRIPLAARIVALADLYDGLTSQRIYKSATDHQVARSIVVQGSGTHFDPRIVEAFERTENQFVEIAQRLPDAIRVAA